MTAASPKATRQATPAADRRAKVAAIADPLAVARWCVLAIAGLVPLAASYYAGFSETALPLTYDQYALVKFALALALAAVGLGAWLAYAGTADARLRRVPAVEYVALGAWGWSAVATAASIDPGTAVLGVYGRFEGLAALTLYLITGFLAIQTIDSVARVRQLAWVLSGSGALVGLYGVLQSLGVLGAPAGTLDFEASRAFATYGNPDMLGLFLLVPFTLAVALALDEASPRLRAVAWICALLALAGILVSYTRAAWVAVMLAAVALAVAAWRRRTRLAPIDGVFAGIAALALGVLVARSASSGSEVTNFLARLSSVFDPGSQSLAARRALWDAALGMVAERPLVGFGPDTFLLKWGAFMPDPAVVTFEGWADNAHSLPLHLAAGSGVAGALLTVGALVLPAILAFRAAFVTRDAPLIAAGIWTALVAVLAAALISVTDVGLSVIVWLLAATVVAPRARSSRLGPQRGRGSVLSRPLAARTTSATAGAPASRFATTAALAATVAGTLVAALGLAASGALLAADHAMARARIEASTPAGAEQAARAAALNPLVPDYRLELGTQHIARFEAAIQAADQLTAQAAFGDAETVLSALATSEPYFIEARLSLVRLYVIAGRVFGGGFAQEAQRQAQAALELAPRDPGVRATLDSLSSAP